MIWKEKIHTRGNLARLLMSSGFPPGIEDIARLVPEIPFNPKAIYSFETNKNIAGLLKSAEPYIDNSFCIGAVGIDDKKTLYEYVEDFDLEVEDILLETDLLFIFDVKMADEREKRRIIAVVTQRGRSGKPTAVDFMPDWIGSVQRWYEARIDLS